MQLGPSKYTQCPNCGHYDTYGTLGTGDLIMTLLTLGVWSIVVSMFSSQEPKPGEPLICDHCGHMWVYET
jgi:hypothetical protein